MTEIVCDFQRPNYWLSRHLKKSVIDVCSRIFPGQALLRHSALNAIHVPKPIPILSFLSDHSEKGIHFCVVQWLILCCILKFLYPNYLLHQFFFCILNFEASTFPSSMNHIILMTKSTACESYNFYFHRYVWLLTAWLSQWDSGSECVIPGSSRVLFRGA